MNAKQEYNYLKQTNQLTYANNPLSLFRKYAPLLTSLTKHQTFRDYLTDSFKMPQEHLGLLLPHGYIRKNRYGEYQMIICPKPTYTKKLLPALRVIDFFNKNHLYATWEEMQKAFLYELEELRLFSNPFGYQYAQARMRYLTLTVNPDANPETTSVDGDVQQGTASTAWATLRGSAGNDHNDDFAGSSQATQLVANAADSSGNYTYFMRGVFLFDTSALTANAIISAAVFSLYIAGKGDDYSQSVSVGLSSPASNTALANSDFANSHFTFTRQASDLTIAGMSTSAYADWTLNATGLGNVSKTGITKLSAILSSDMDNSAPTWINPNPGGKSSYINVNWSDAGSNKPKLVVTYTNSSPSSSASPTPSSSVSLSVSPSPSSSVSPTPSSSVSLSISRSPSSSISPTPSSSVSLSISPSPSLSPSLSPSFSPSASVSPSSSISLSLSPSPSVSVSLSPSSTPSSSVSASISLSPSLSMSLTPSLSPSLSVSLSISPSPSTSVSLSPSISVSASPSRSPSSSESRSQSPSHSPSPSCSPSLSASVSDSPSPSQPVSLYTREGKVSLPTNKNDLAIVYTTKEEGDVYSNDSIYVGLTDTATKYLIHQYKKLNNNRSDWIRVRVDLKTTIAPSDATVYLQVWDGVTNAWVTTDSESEKDANTDFSLYADVTEDVFRDGSWYDIFNEFACRVYQLNSSGSQTLSVDLVQISFLIPYEELYVRDEDCSPNSYSPKYPHKNQQDDREEDKF